MKIEILANSKIKYAFQELGIKGTRTYKGSREPFYEVWEIEKSDLSTLEEYIGWPDKWGWWRYAKGSNMGTACSFFAVNDFELIAWDGAARDNLRDDWDDMSNEEKEKKSIMIVDTAFDIHYQPETLMQLLEEECGKKKKSEEVKKNPSPEKVIIEDNKTNYSSNNSNLNL